jgi:hypothetical protein
MTVTIVESTLIDSNLDELDNAIETAEEIIQCRTGIRYTPMSDTEVEFRDRYLSALYLLAQEMDRKLTQLERVPLFMQMKEEAQALPKSKCAIVAGELAAYHGWTLRKVSLSQGCTRYAYNEGLVKGRKYCEIDPQITAWIFER